ncbi:MAG: uncharacterized protein QOJ76_1357 [Acidobacteriota bacterium]|nr:uncharacterized protein [Acidobacteriota bacterium]
MDALLNETEVRVLGSLVEKQVTTPDYYPLTLNALLHACNQISNRDPAVHYDEPTVMGAVDTLRGKNLVYIFYGADSRVPKYKHMMGEVFSLSPPELAAMCVLMLRGPQTVGEIRGRTGRLYEFADLREAEATLDGLAQREAALVTKLPRQAGRKEARYAHLLAGLPVVEESGDEQTAMTTPHVARTSSSARAQEGERIVRLEAEVERLSGELAEMRRRFDEFRSQFE